MATLNYRSFRSYRINTWSFSLCFSIPKSRVGALVASIVGQRGFFFLYTIINTKILCTMCIHQLDDYIAPSLLSGRPFRVVFVLHVMTPQVIRKLPFSRVKYDVPGAAWVFLAPNMEIAILQKGWLLSTGNTIRNYNLGAILLHF